MTVAVPPIKCQGIKTKIVPLIKAYTSLPIDGYWVEPFCGSGVVALNVQPERAILADTNKHIVKFYREIQSRKITPTVVQDFLRESGEILSKRGGDYYYEVRERFNETGESLDFLFLNRACFNGVMRFNRYGKFNVPFGHKPDRFRQAYITKIANQVKRFEEIIRSRDWKFEVADFRDTLSHVTAKDFVYADPPYMGRHVDYYNSWSETDDIQLILALKNLPTRFLLSTWHSNKYRTNTLINQYWNEEQFFIQTQQHFYHVGSTEELRNEMTEALISNYKLQPIVEPLPLIEEQLALFQQ